MNDIVTIALKEIDTKEIPPNSNMTKYGKWFGVNGVPWCGIFVSFCYAMANKALGNIGYSRGYAGCSTMYVYASGKGWITDKPVAGDIILYSWKKNKVFDHTGIFIEMLPNGFVSAIEGNTSVGNESDGGQVMKRMRDIGTCTFIHPPQNIN